MIAKQTHNKRQFSILEFAWSVQFSMMKSNNNQSNRNHEKNERQQEKYWIRNFKPTDCDLLRCSLLLQFANVSIWKSRKNRDYLRIIPFYFIFSFIFFPFLSVWNAPLNFVFLCSFLHGTLIFCLLFALILMYTYLFARLFAHGNKNRWTSTTENQMRTCT